MPSLNAIIDGIVRRLNAHASRHGATGPDPVTLLATQVEVAELGTATYDDVQDYINFFGDRGLLTGGAISDAGSGIATIASCTAWCKVTDSDTAIGKFFDFAGANTSVLTDQTTHFIYLDYNNGVPQLVTATSILTHGFKLDHILLGTAFRNGATLHYHPVDKINIDRINRVHMWLVEMHGVHRATGMLTTDAGSLALNISAGVLHAGLNRQTSSAMTPASWSYWYTPGDSGATWTEEASQSALAQYYNDIDNSTGGTPGKFALGTGKYGVHWVFMDNDGTHIHIVYGQGNYTPNQAEEAGVPAVMPNLVLNYCTLIAKIISHEGTNDLVITYPWTTAFTSSLATDHNLLGSLQGGTAGEYYHLTSARHTLLATDLTATAAELNLLDLAALTAGELLVATGAASAAWQSTGVVLTAPKISGSVTTDGLTLPAFTGAGAVILNSSLNVGGAITGTSASLSSTLGVAGITQLQRTLIHSTLSVAGQTTLAKTIIGSTLGVAGLASFVNAFVTNDIIVGGTVDGVDVAGHAANTTTAHGAVSAATASKIVVRDASARAKFAAPGASGDALIKGTRVTIAELPAMTDEKIWKGTGTNVEEVDWPDLAGHVAAADPHTGYMLESIIDAEGDIIYGSGDNAIARLAKGDDDDVLTLASGVPSWAAPAADGAGDYPMKLEYDAVRYVMPGWYIDLATTSVPYANYTFYIPIFVEKDTTYIRIGISVVVLSAGTADLRIFEWDNGLPGALVLSAGTVNTGATGIKEITISQLLTRGYYFLAIRCTGTPTLKCPRATDALKTPVAGWAATLSLEPFLVALATSNAYDDPAPAMTLPMGEDRAYVMLREN